MNILFLNTSRDKGGAAIAAGRIMKSLEAYTLPLPKGGELNAELLSVDDLNVPSWKKKWKKAWERLVIFIHNGFTMKNLWTVSLADTGFDITKTEAFRRADIVHLHWVNQGFLSLNDVEKIVRSGKPVVWTMHDMWPLTGICHHARDCERYQSECRDCPQLCRPSSHDLSYKVFQQKLSLYSNTKIHFVTCSKWLRSQAEKSALLQNNTVTDIPNPIDTDVFCPEDSNEARKKMGLPQDKKIILFGAARADDKRKGVDYFVEACKALYNEKPELRDRICVASYGQNSDALKEVIPFDVVSLGYIKGTDNMKALYNAADTFVIPSLEENLPNTIMESMSCARPCVGFNVGGIPEMIDHRQNGYVANYKDAADLAKGICYVLFDSGYDELSSSARQKVLDTYSQKAVAKQYLTLYNNLLNSLTS